MDLGACTLIHDPALKADYRRDPDRKKYAYELDALEHLQAFIRDSDHRTELAKAKLRETQEELTDEAQQKAEKINALSEQIGTKLARAEQLGADGRVDESLDLMKEVEELNKEKSRNESELRTAIPTSTYQQQKLRVCEVCSAYLGIHDNDRRLADHFGGKLHLGFIEIREKLAELRQVVQTEQIVRRRRFEGYNRSTFSREMEKQRESSRHRERSRDRKHRSRSRSRSRSHSRHRNKRRSSRSNGRHSRDRRYRSSRDRSEDRY
ncbi:RNA-binding protein Luc7 1 [Fasciolopsis buskii]|uniref:RNA-binding protein Luc7 1 n=1 Tax=Fasciolopsis buskii TaxID=27845 RepID=A0A8E0RJF1_9TREM|nr:RNA-binding protein Luc7 1 [Fasciolopsis buski]